MAKGGGCHPSPSTGFSSFSQKWEEILEILATFNLFLVDLEWVNQSITSKRSDKQLLRFLEGVATPLLPLARYVSRNGLTIGGLRV